MTVRHLTPPASAPADHRAAVKGRLAVLDLARARPLEEIVLALLDGTDPPEAAVTRLRALGTDAESLRAELAGIGGGGA